MKKQKDRESTEDVPFVPEGEIGGVPTPPDDSEPDETNDVKLDKIIQMLSNLQGRVDHQGTSLSKLTDTVAGMQTSFSAQLASLQTKAANEKKEIDEKLAQLQNMVASTSTDPTAPAASSQYPPARACEGAASGNYAAAVAAAAITTGAAARPAFPQRASRPSSAPASSRTRANSDQYKILALGFPRDIPRNAHINFYNSIVQLCGNLLDNTTCLAGNGKAHSIKFDSADDKRAFMKSYRNHKDSIRRVDPRNEESIEIYFKDIKEPEAATKGKALSPYYGLVERHMGKENAAKWFPPGADLIPDTKKGRLMLRTDNDLWILATIKNEKVEPDTDVFQSFGISASSVEDLAPSVAT
jgi:hypothetical protein